MPHKINERQRTAIPVSFIWYPSVRARGGFYLCTCIEAYEVTSIALPRESYKISKLLNFCSVASCEFAIARN